MIKILMSLGDWELRHSNAGLGYYVSHRQCPTLVSSGRIDTRTIAWVGGDAKPRCYGCHTTVPDEMQALIVLLT